jgi:hypothetical protein
LYRTNQKWHLSSKFLFLGMQESWKFSVPLHLQTKDLEQLLISLLVENEKEMGIFLSYYFKKEGAVAEKVQLETPPQFKEKFKGIIWVSFDLVYFNACLNIHEQNRDKMELGFEFSEDLSALKLIGPYWPEREMDEI